MQFQLYVQEYGVNSSGAERIGMVKCLIYVNMLLISRFFCYTDTDLTESGKALYQLRYKQ